MGEHPSGAEVAEEGEVSHVVPPVVRDGDHPQGHFVQTHTEKVEEARRRTRPPGHGPRARGELLGPHPVGTPARRLGGVPQPLGVGRPQSEVLLRVGDPRLGPTERAAHPLRAELERQAVSATTYRSSNDSARRSATASARARPPRDRGDTPTLGRAERVARAATPGSSASSSTRRLADGSPNRCQASATYQADPRRTPTVRPRRGLARPAGARPGGRHGAQVVRVLSATRGLLADLQGVVRTVPIVEDLE